MLAAYHPKAVESAWYEWWVKKGFFTADPYSSKPKYVIMIPPPNVTGYLHLGHALTNAIQDAIIRWRRMSGYNCLYLPGTDHAGIATQVVVEKKLKKTKNLTRHDLGREAFVDEVWKWKNEYGNRICSQLRRMGSSYDWSREHFTMDEQLSKAVVTAFVRLYDEGLIYREKRLVNWSCQLKSAISDLEVDNQTLEKPDRLRVPGHIKSYEFGYLWEFAYKIENSNDEIVVATTRPETMLGDTAIAVHPADPRYTHLHGKFAVHPFLTRRLPIICDAELVDMTFGTGAVKITPAHDPNDFATGRRHQLPEINIFTEDGAINENGGEFKGMMRFDARVAILKALDDKGLLRGKVPNPGQNLPRCDRSGDVVEPLLKQQWWMNCKPSAEEAVKAAKDGRLTILPASQRQHWFHWLENIKDWCISRQLWWGHRIPAYYIVFQGEPEGIPKEEDKERWVVAETAEAAKARAAAKFPGRSFTVLQDEDVLDTWFSSGLFPFSTLGWPDTNNPDFKAFYPTSLLETGQDILFFWVARMVMLGQKLTGELPFHTVYLHSMVRDKNGRKMSKSLGNVIDPIDVVEGISLPSLHQKVLDGNLDPKEVERALDGQKKDYPEGIAECGTDALRFALCSYTAQGRDINLDVKRVEGYRNFCNKLWNATRFAMTHLGADFKPDPISTLPNRQTTFYACRWILSRLNAAISSSNRNFADYEFGVVTQDIYDFSLKEFCDVYLELAKPVMALPDSEPLNVQRKRHVRNVLYTCLDCGLRLLSPFMPFVTEELWQRLPRRTGDSYDTICIAPYPTSREEWTDSEAEERMKTVLEVVKEARSMRSAYGMPANARPAYYFVSSAEALLQTVTAQVGHIQSLIPASTFTISSSSDNVPKGTGNRPFTDIAEIHIVLKGLVDFDKEITNLNKEKGTLEKSIDSTRKRTQLPSYEEKVPATVREQTSQKLAQDESKLEGICKAIQELVILKQLNAASSS